MRASRSIDTSKAEAVPGVVAVLTAETLKTVNLAWMPTLAGDVQMVLADGKVLFQNQEVAFVVADDRYAAADGVELVEVDYEALPVNVDPLKAMAPDAPVIREDLKDKTDGRPRAAQAPQPHLRLGGRRQGGRRRGVREGRRHDQGVSSYPALPPVPARDLPVRRLLRQDQGRAHALGHLPGAARHPHRGLADLEDPRAQDPRDRAGYRRRLRQQGRRLFRLHLRDRRLDRDRPAGEVDRGPHREPLHHGLRARLPHGDGDRLHQGRQDHRPARLHHRRPRRVRRLRQRHANGRPGSSRSSPGSYDFPAAHCSVDGVYTNKAPGGVAYRCSFRVTEAAYCHRARHGHHGAEARHGSGRVPHEEPDPARAVPLQVGVRLGIRFRRLPDRHAEGDRRGRLQGAPRRAEGEAGGLQARRDPRADGHRRRLLHRDRRRRPVARLRHPRHRHVRFRRDPHPSDRHRHLPASAPSARARATRPPTPRSSPPSSARRRQHHGGGGQHRHRPLRPRHLRLALDAGLRRRDRHGVPKDQGEGADDRRLPARGARRRPRMGRRPIPREGQSGALQDHDRARLGGLPRGAAGHGAGARGGQLLRPAELHLSRSAPTSASSTSTSTPARPRSAASTRSTIAAPASTR